MTAEDTEATEYEDWKSNIRSELEAFEGNGPPSAEELWYSAQYDANSAASWIQDMPCTEEEIKTVKGDVLKALVALEMAEERLDDDTRELGDFS